MTHLKKIGFACMKRKGNASNENTAGVIDPAYLEAVSRPGGWKPIVDAGLDAIVAGKQLPTHWHWYGNGMVPTTSQFAMAVSMVSREVDMLYIQDSIRGAADELYAKQSTWEFDFLPNGVVRKRLRHPKHYVSRILNRLLVHLHPRFADLELELQEVVDIRLHV
jgi:hypothetical protein